MGYRVTFESGQSVVFDNEPTDADIEEAEASLGVSKQVETGSPNKAAQIVSGGALGALDFIAGMVPASISGLSMVGNKILGKSTEQAVEEGQNLGKTIEDYILPSRLLEKSGVNPEYVASKNWAYQQTQKPLEKLSELGTSIGDWSQEHGAPPSVAAASKALTELGIMGGAFHGIGKGGLTLESKLTQPKVKPQLEETPKVEPTFVPEEQPISQQMEMFDNDVSNNMYRARSTAVDENGIPINREASLEAQTTARMGDLFDESRIAQEEAKATVEKNRQIDEAYRQKEEQQKAEADLIEQRKQVIEEPLTMEPSQGSINRGEVDFTEGLGPKDASHPKVADVKVRAEIAIGDNNFKGALEAVRELKDQLDLQPQNRFLGHLADTILKNTRIDPETVLGKETGMGGFYENSTGKLSWNRATQGGRKLFDLMHEAVHAAVNKALILFDSDGIRHLNTAQKIAAKHLNDLFKNKVLLDKEKLFALYEQSGMKTEVAVNHVHNLLSNVREFVAYGATDPVLRQYLLEQKYQGRSLTGQLAEAYRRIVGMEKKFQTEFDRFMWGTEALIRESDGKAFGEGKDFSKDPKVEAVKKIPGLKTKGQDYEFRKYDWKDRTDALEVIKQAKDFDGEPSAYTKQLAPRGYLSAEILNNEAYHAAVSVIKGALDHFANRSEKMLFQHGGLYAEMTRGESLFSPGRMVDLTKQLVAAKGNKDFKFNLTPEQTKIKDQWNQMSKELWQEVRDTVSPSKAKNLPPEIDNFFPGIFEGPWLFEVRDSATGKPLIWTSNNKWVAKIRAKKLAHDGYLVGQVRKRPAIESEGFGRENMVAEYQLMIEAFSDKDTSNLRQRINASISADAMTEWGYQNHLKDWRGYKGNLGNNPFFSDSKNYYNAKEAMKRYVEAHNQWMAAQELSKFYKELSDVHTTAPMARDYAQKYISDVIGKSDPDVFIDSLLEVTEAIHGQSIQSQKAIMRGMATATTVQMLGASFRALTQNFFQQLDVILPKLIAESKNPIDIFTPLAKAQVAYAMVLAKHQLGEVLDLVNVLTKAELHLPDELVGARFTEKYKYAVDKGVVDVTLLEQTPPFKGKLSNTLWKSGTGLLTRSSEQAARFASFTAFTDYLIQAGWPKESAMEQARQWTEAHMTDYSIHAKPAILANNGALGDTLGRLQTYKANQFGRYYDYIKLAGRNKDLVPLTTMLTMGILTAGVQGIVGFDIINALFSATSKLSDDPDTKEFSLLAYLAKHNNPMVTWGVLSTATNQGFSNSFSQPLLGDGSFSNLFPVISQEIEQGRAIAGLAKDTIKGDLDAVPDFEMGRRLSALSPQLIQQQIHEKYLTKNGKAISKYTGLPGYQYKEGDKWMSNVMPYGRMVDSALEAEHRASTKRFEEGKTDKLEQIKALSLDLSYGKPNPFKSAKVDKLVEDYTSQYYGDAKGLVKALKDLQIAANLPDHNYQTLMKKLTVSRYPEVRRALEYLDIKEKQQVQ